MGRGQGHPAEVAYSYSCSISGELRRKPTLFASSSLRVIALTPSDWYNEEMA